MSKTKEQVLKEQDNLMEYYIGFYEWLDALKNDLNEKDINQMEEVNKENQLSLILKANNTHFRPSQGANL